MKQAAAHFLAICAIGICSGTTPLLWTEVAKGESLCPRGAINVEPGQSIQAAADRAGKGAVFCLKNGLHRLQEITPKDSQTFYGEQQTMLSGAREVKHFQRQGATWIAEHIAEKHPAAGVCADKFPNCNLPDRVFFDDKPLQPVLRKEELQPGSFLVAGDRLYLVDDPHGHRVEVTVARFAFAGHADNVRIENLLVEKYSNPAQAGAIFGRLATGWTIKNVEARWNSGAGISVGSRGVISHCNVHENGQLGVNAGGEDILIEGNEIWRNNVYGFDQDWEAGGIKVSEAGNVRFLKNHVHDNRGPGIWCDINCRNVLYASNVVEANEGPGIFHEISFDAIVRNNVLRSNGTRGNRWYWTDEIKVAGSEHVEIYRNQITVAPGIGAVMLIDQGRPAQGSWHEEYKTRDNYVHDNTIDFEGDGSVGGISDTSPGDPNYNVIMSGPNRFDRNFYRSPQNASIIFPWGHDELDWRGFQRIGEETHGSLTTY